MTPPPTDTLLWKHSLLLHQREVCQLCLSHFLFWGQFVLSARVAPTNVVLLSPLYSYCPHFNETRVYWLSSEDLGDRQSMTLTLTWIPSLLWFCHLQECCP